MPLHDWTDQHGWEGLFHFWLAEIGRALKATLPPGHRSYIKGGPSPMDPMEDDRWIEIEKDGRPLATVQLLSPRNKDRPPAREQYAARYLAYLRAGVHLLLVDVHRRPIDFGFSQLIAADLGSGLPSLPAPSVVSYRVGANAATGGRMLALWREPLAVGEPLPAMPLALTNDLAVSVELEATYTRAAADCYL